MDDNFLCQWKNHTDKEQADDITIYIIFSGIFN